MDQTLAMTSSAVAVQLIDVQSRFQVATNALMSRSRTLTELKVPRRISCRVIKPRQPCP